MHLGGLRETGAGGEPLGLVLTRSVLGVSLEGGFGKICPMAPSVLVSAGPGSPSVLPSPAGVQCTWEHSLCFSRPWQEEKGALITCLGEARFR